MPQPAFERKFCPPGELAARVAEATIRDGSVHSFPFRHHTSTPTLLERIRS